MDMFSFRTSAYIPCEIHPVRTVELNHYNSCLVTVSCNTQIIMCDEHLQSVSRRVPILILHRIEKTFATLREGTVSDVYMHACTEENFIHLILGFTWL